jgi:DNA/RNA-binding domain of Phe-tRNA-synthetase-like protein
MKKKLAPEDCLACVLHQRISVKDIIEPLIARRDKALERAERAPTNDHIESAVVKAWDDFYEAVNKTDVERVSFTDDPKEWNGLWDMYTHSEEGVIYAKEII